jgi:predicted transposase YbfD/YdcC
MASKETLAYRKANNLCPRDGRPNKSGRKLCEYCLRKSAEKTARHRQKKKDSGLCLSCGTQVDGQKFCNKCKESVATTSHNSYVKRYSIRKKKNQCTVCGGEIAIDAISCRKCLDKQIDRQKAIRDKNTHGGLCVQCGGDLGSSTGKRCKTCIEKRNEWYQGSTTQDKDKKRRDNHRVEVLEHYGGKCVCCGETEPYFLAVDHISGDGNSHRRKINKWGSGFFKWLIDNQFPDGFQVLCHNCRTCVQDY